jgi:hypothetical protein
MFSKLFGGAGQSAATASNAPLSPARHFSDNAPSWEDLQALVTAQQAKLGDMPHDLEAGPPTTASLKRTFGKGEPRITLYRDHAAWCPYCHKIVLQLEEKKIPYNVVKINMRCYGDKPSEFLQKVREGVGKCVCSTFVGSKGIVADKHRPCSLDMNVCTCAPPQHPVQVPSGLLPVLELDGKVITESAVIQQVSRLNKGNAEVEAPL